MKLIVTACLALVGQMLLVVTSYGQDIADQFATGGRVVYESQPAQREYRIALSGLKKVNSQWRVSREEKVQGLVERKTVELASSTTYSESKKQLEEALARMQGARAMFTCEGLDCGSSSGWANHIMGNKILYGLDQYQYYRVLRMEQNGETIYAVYYLVQRGSGRVYLQQDIVRASADAETREVTEASLHRHLTDRGYWTILGNDSAPQTMSIKEVALLAALMGKNPNWRLAVVGHNYQKQPLEEQRERSLLHAKLIEKQLVDAGISASRIKSWGLGSLAPAGKVSNMRVELVLLNL